MLAESTKLILNGEAKASLHFLAHEAGAIGFLAGRPLSWRLTDAFDRPIDAGTGDSLCRAVEKGGYRLTFTPFDGEKIRIQPAVTGAITPYLMPGVGVLWQHGARYPLLLDGGAAHTLWLLASPAEKLEAAAVIKGIPNGEAITVRCDGEAVGCEWYPKLGRPWFWHTAAIPTAECVRFGLPAGETDIRFTAYNRTVAALKEPAGTISWGSLSLTATDANGEPIDARFEIFIGSERIALRDQLADESEPVYLPQGRYTVRVSHGKLWNKAEATVDVGIDPATCALSIAPEVHLPEGWVFGELHTHSSLEDATLFPRHVMRAARCTGLSFCFMTDKDIDRLDEMGLHDVDVPGRFLALPGQEIMCHELHTNVLNPTHRIENPEADFLSRPNPDIEAKLEGWLGEYQSMRAEQPCLIMHNHPTHRPEAALKGQPYFRSWWVHDLHPETYTLVENCGYAEWFDRLNRGHRLYAAWTGDGHDCTLMEPGKEGICLHLGGELSAANIIRALEAGDFFSLRAPGMLLQIEYDGQGRIGIRAASGRVIEKIELIGDGRVIERFDGAGQNRLGAGIALPQGLHWVMARAKLVGSEWEEATHSFTPFMQAGWDAFTNPIFLEDNAT